jgi:hypothetical protein
MSEVPLPCNVLRVDGQHVWDLDTTGHPSALLRQERERKGGREREREREKEGEKERQRKREVV